VITTGGNLRAKYVIHTVGPVWHGGKKGEPELLAGAYWESLALAVDNKITSISFPSLSTGAYGYPVASAAQVAIAVVISFLRQDITSIKEIFFVLFNLSDLQAYSSALKEILRK
jgi:O-acetyl-ADP-ribose deacetylase (regulator of RNase III)